MDNNIKPSFVASIGVIVISIIAILIMGDTNNIDTLKWLIMVFILSIAMRPYLYICNLELWDNGFGLSFGLGAALAFLASWIIASCKIALFGTALCVLVTIILTLIGVIYIYKCPAAHFKWDKAKLSKHIEGFALFMVLFLLAFWIRGFNSTINNQTENYMNFGFIQTIFRQQQFVPLDVWFSGENLNYYYLGHAIVVFLCRISFITPECGYNLMLVTIWSMLFMMTGEIAYGVMHLAISQNSDNKEAIVRSSVFASIIASCMSALAGNGQWLVYGLFDPIIRRIKGMEAVDYWYPSPTTYISVANGDMDNGKTEFPAYSAVLGDLHAHVVDSILVLLVVAFLFDYAFLDKEEERKSYIHLLYCGLLLALFKGVNYWDFAIYFVITGAIVVFCDIKRKGWKINTVAFIGVKAAMVVALSYIFILPFSLHFVKISSSIKIAENHTPLLKLVVLWGIPFCITLEFLKWMYLDEGRLLVFKGSFKAGLMALSLCTMGLVLTPEVIYMKDIYGIENARFNTMFKMTFQAFILFAIIIGIAAGFSFYRAFYTLDIKTDSNSLHRKVKDRVLKKSMEARIVMITIASFTVLSSLYMVEAVGDWYGNVLDINRRIGISATKNLSNDVASAFEMRAAEYINADDNKVVNIVEAQGDSFTHNDLLSVITGACTVCGWYAHEWLWRDNVDIVGERSEEVRRFYESGDIEYCREFLEKYDIDYIFIGPAEYSRYAVVIDAFEGLGDICISEDNEGQKLELIKVH